MVVETQVSEDPATNFQGRIVGNVAIKDHSAFYLICTVSGIGPFADAL